MTTNEKYPPRVWAVISPDKSHWFYQSPHEPDLLNLSRGTTKEEYISKPEVDALLAEKNREIAALTATVERYRLMGADLAETLEQVLKNVDMSMLYQGSIRMLLDKWKALASADAAGECGVTDEEHDAIMEEITKGGLET